MARNTITVVLVALLAFAARAQISPPPDVPELRVAGYPEREPTPDARENLAYEWTSDSGLRYAWNIPQNYRQDRERDLIIMLHSVGVDHRWAHAGHDPARFRPDDIIVSVEGTTKLMQGGRAFLGEPDDAQRLASFIEEMREVFEPRRVILYGHGQGAFFAIYYDGLHPQTVDAVVAHAGGAWEQTDISDGLLETPIVIMHATDDTLNPYRNALGARTGLENSGHEVVRLRRLPGFGPWHSPTRTSECIDWCLGMTTDDAGEAMELVRSMLTVPTIDKQGYRCAVPFGMAVDVLQRVEGTGWRPIESATEDQRRRAMVLRERIEGEGEAHAERLRASVATRDDLTIDAGEWLGYALAVREDFRGVTTVEAYFDEIGFDELQAEHAVNARPILAAWYAPQKDGDTIVRTVGATLPNAFLYDGYPGDLLAYLDRVVGGRQLLEQGTDIQQAIDVYERWRVSRQRGLTAYADRWLQWRS